MAENQEDVDFEDQNYEDPGTCSICGKEYEIVRPGKSQPTCDCYMRCPCGRMKSYYEVGEHPTEQGIGGYLCPTCGMIGPSEIVLNKSLVRAPFSGDEQRARLLCYIRFGNVKLPIPFGHGFFLSNCGELMYSPWSDHAMKNTWSIDSTFPLIIPDQIVLTEKMGLWVMISSVVLIALDGHPEAGKWNVVYELATAMEKSKLKLLKNHVEEFFFLDLINVSCQKKNLFMRKMKDIKKDMSYADIKKTIRCVANSPFKIGKYTIAECLRLQEELFQAGGYTKIRRAP